MEKSIRLAVFEITVGIIKSEKSIAKKAIKILFAPAIYTAVLGVWCADWFVGCGDEQESK